MSNQPTALFLAEVIESDPSIKAHHEAAAAELRRLVAEHEEDQRVIAVWRGRTQRAEAQRDALLRALNMAVQWVEEYASQMRAYTTSEQANADLSVIYAVIKAVKEGK